MTLNHFVIFRSIGSVTEQLFLFVFHRDRGDEMSPKGVFKEFNSEIRKSLMAAK
jgi:hypothetical protein